MKYYDLNVKYFTTYQLFCKLLSINLITFSRTGNEYLKESKLRPYHLKQESLFADENNQTSALNLNYLYNKSFSQKNTNLITEMYESRGIIHPVLQAWCKRLQPENLSACQANIFWCTRK
jgi:hypothetical protein